METGLPLPAMEALESHASKREDNRRTLGYVLAVGALAWGVAFVVGRATDVGHVAIATGMLMMGIGAWTAVVAWPNFLTGLAAPVISGGAIVMAYVAIDRLMMQDSAQIFTTDEYGMLMFGAGLAVTGLMIALLPRAPRWFGLVLLITAVAWTSTSVIDSVSSDITRVTGSLLVVSLFAFGVTTASSARQFRRFTAMTGGGRSGMGPGAGSGSGPTTVAMMAAPAMETPRVEVKAAPMPVAPAPAVVTVAPVEVTPLSPAVATEATGEAAATKPRAPRKTAAAKSDEPAKPRSRSKRPPEATTDSPPTDGPGTLH